MADHLSRSRRSEVMGNIRSKNTSPELRVRRAAHALGLRFQIHRRDLPGRPDLVFPRWKTAIFVNGCFWHQHSGCARAVVPRTRAEFWSAKFRRNVARDAEVAAALEAAGWTVSVIWECETKSPQGLLAKLRALFGVSSESQRQKKSATSDDNAELASHSSP